jgi:hypothetical protein
MRTVALDLLRESVELERRSDLMAHACNFGEASRLMRQANRIREREFGRFDPNELRERTQEALSKAHHTGG